MPATSQPNRSAVDHPESGGPAAPPSRTSYHVAKALLDYLIVVPALLLLTPLLALLAIIIKVESAGPVFSRQPTIGRHGRKFNALRFRTRYIPPASGLTRPGYVLYHYHLDELPLLFNVLKREMSLIGPHLSSSGNAQRDGRSHPLVQQALPGLTGLWQISNTTSTERPRADLAYIQDWSIWLDIKILLLTVPAVLRS